jgi:Ca2+-transporting ATPase
VIARATPAEKLELVRALQAAGEVVAVTGDGVNDVPALQAADIGVAMGERGVRSAREAAAIVLLDDDFGTIVRAVAEGRQLFANLRRSFLYLIALHIPLVATATLVPLAGFPLLYLPIHVVWLELIIHPTAMLAFQDVADPGLAHRRRAPARFFSRRDWIALGATGALLTAALLGAWLRSLGAGHDEAHARAVALASLTTASVALTAVLTRFTTRPARVLAVGTALASAILLQTPPLARLLAVSPLHLDDWALAATTSAVAILPLAWQARPRSD